MRQTLRCFTLCDVAQHQAVLKYLDISAYFMWKTSTIAGCLPTTYTGPWASHLVKVAPHLYAAGGILLTSVECGDPLNQFWLTPWSFNTEPLHFFLRLMPGHNIIGVLLDSRTKAPNPRVRWIMKWTWHLTYYTSISYIFIYMYIYIYIHIYTHCISVYHNIGIGWTNHDISSDGEFSEFI